MSVLVYQPRAEQATLALEMATDHFRRAAEPVGLAVARQKALRALADDWLEQAYEAERDGNPRRARYLVGLVGRL